MFSEIEHCALLYHFIRTDLGAVGSRFSAHQNLQSEISENPSKSCQTQNGWDDTLASSLNYCRRVTLFSKAS